MLLCTFLPSALDVGRSLSSFFKIEHRIPLSGTQRPSEFPIESTDSIALQPTLPYGREVSCQRGPGALTLAGSNRGETCCVFARPSGPIVLVLVLVLVLVIVLETGQNTKFTLDQSESESGTSDFSDRSFDKDRCAPRTRTRTRTRTIANPPTGNFPTRNHLELPPANPHVH